MSIINMQDLGLDQTFEPEITPDNTEVKVRIIEAVEGISGKGNVYIRLRLEVADNPKAQSITTFINIPNPQTQDEKKLNNSRRFFKRWTDAFGIDQGRALNPEVDLPGMEAWAIVGVDVSDEYGEQNNVKRWVTPK